MKLSRRTLMRVTGVAVGGTAIGASTATASFSDGEEVQMTTDLNGREGPGLHYDVVRTYPEGTTGEIMNGPEESDGYTWWGLHVPSYGEWVWCAGTYLTSGGGGSPGDCTDQYYTSQNVDDLARVITSEASISETPARTAVGFTVLTRMEQQGVSTVRDVWGAYARNQSPTAEITSLADDILRCAVSDNSGGATHFYSPMSMPKEGEDTSGYDTSGGLEWTEGLDRRNYRPGWALDLEYVPVDGVPEREFKFYR
ncbi:SH3 domain-containing protein [Natronorubrum halophilum]|uniref:SH3 domain-containing protein n=1 Tax=Natronorubrum halophilum TaxID=1702106 RepID=UPI0037445D00